MQPPKEFEPGIYEVKWGGRVYGLVFRRFHDVIIVRDTGSHGWFVVPAVKPHVAADHIPKHYKFREAVEVLLPDLLKNFGKLPEYNEWEDYKEIQKKIDARHVRKIFF